MKELCLFATKDRVTEEMTNSPQMYKNKEVAKRAWSNAIQTLAKNPQNDVPIKDLEFYQIGTIDLETMEIKSKIDYVTNGLAVIDELNVKE